MAYEQWLSNGNVKVEVDGSNRYLSIDGLLKFERHTFLYTYLSTNQSINSGTLTKVQFNTVSTDKLSEYDNTTNYRWTATYSGYYHIIAQVEFNVTADGDDLLVVAQINGGINRLHYYQEAGGPVIHTININGFIYFDANDYLEIYARNDSNNDTITGSNEKRTFLQIYRLPI